ncbi:putative carotenoid cyclase [Deinococcus seoulensis]|uniref:Carotenoid cyclase n=1 Tax=Deinococcus seoulensis TaxID=1837379 RepID=A0ABQ2RSZ4_9DEIO|nr:lycopene cyclase family protein [Deinococcus seoulensis]GGR63732.1 putative carotenoid cyclase [Deinococcus seoulensis]
MTADAPLLSGPPTDALIVGAGPAGLALAAELTARGLSVRVTDPHPHAPFPATYGAWHGDLPGWAQACAAHTWADVRVHTGPQPTPLLRPYTLLDNTALRAALLGRAGPGLTLTAARVDGAERVNGAARTDGGWTVQGTRDGQPARWEARVVIDASGHRPALLRQPDRHPDGAALQTAFGIVATFDRPPSAPGAAVWMDYRAPHGPGDTPTFLYAMHLGGDRYFVEETSLIARPAPTRQTLEARLHARLHAQGTPAREVLSEEWVSFPMNTAPPAPDGVLAFGAAAGMVHPISGFQVAGALRDAPTLADAIAGALRDGRDPTRAGWDALWPPERRAARAVHLLGVQALLNLPPRALPAFFAAFFALPPARWHAFLDPRTPPGPLARTMLRLFAHAPVHVRLPLARAALRHAGTSLHALNAAARTLTA